MRIKLAILIMVSFFTASSYAFNLTWTHDGLNTDGYKVYRQKPGELAFTLLGTTAQKVLTFSDVDRTIGNCYQVTAFSAFGESPSVTACALVPNSITILILK